MFSVLMSTYYKDNPQYLEESLNSLSMSNSEIYEVVIVADHGTPIEVMKVIKENQNKMPIKIVELKYRTPLGEALNIGLQHCSFDLVARFDSDDISTTSRFKHQLDAFIEHPELAIIGGSIAEFETNDINHKVYCIRSMPTLHEDIILCAKWRNPFNHQTVMYRREVILELGGYNSQYEMEDYDLWVRLIQAGYQTANLGNILVLARAGKDLAKRRGGIRFVKAEYRLHKRFYLQGFISVLELIRNLVFRGAFAILPSWSRVFIYKYILRKTVS